MSPTTVNEVLAFQNRDQPSVGHINSLPADVLLDIFEQYVRPGPIYPEAACWMGEPPSARAIEYLHDRGKNSPFIIDQVCQTWRQLCRSNSGLYSDIHIVDPKPQDVVRVKTMLKLSKDRPLRVFLQDRQCTHPATQVSVTAGQGTARRDQSEQRSDHLVSWNRILQSVLSTPRIEKLYLTITHEASSQCWRNTWEMRETNWDHITFPLLTTLYVSMGFKQNMAENIFVRDLVSRTCATSPRLTDVRFDSIFSLFHLTGGDEVGPNELRPTAKMIPWRNLTSLSMCVRYLGKALTILGQCPLLQTVELYGIRNTMFPDTLIASANGDMTSLQQEQNLVREPVNLPFLWSLFLSMGDTVADTFEPLLYLKAPALKCLTLQRTEQRQTGVIPFEMQRDALLGALTVFTNGTRDAGSKPLRICSNGALEMWGTSKSSHTPSSRAFYGSRSTMWSAKRPWNG
ncbi:hypothetical protein CC1G_13332 [Coprinopsis cinerea okayama7|uniref:F-box domain-containing protein n=1 Tax=Coprinopsis cinerea (strain Okayama-7 / 130 / ATCC MYA-4618 / FGSC 9003) TaxID=240176 RepID=A8N4A3_COPC7|nr:hypothetical protein CC1G_13332 [Coprinopsis cinerea okayama7\|eukprot:XP_001829698.2 hypothetical protein CC1G_13332 [Coprinopsis cinerea okayama7\